MPSGFVTRVKGKASFGALGPVTEIIEFIQAGAAGASTGIKPDGLTIIRSTSGATVLTLGPPDPGTYKTISVTTMSSGHIAIKTNSTTGVFFDSTTLAVWTPSTAADVVGRV